jgi:hypothetical protein
MRTRARPSIEEIAAELLQQSNRGPGPSWAGGSTRARESKVNQALAQLEAECEQRAPRPFGASSAYQTPQRFGFIIQAGQAFTESFLTAIEKQRDGDRALEIEGLGASSDEAVVEAIKGRTGGMDRLAIVCKNTPPIIDELNASQAGKA